MCTFAAFKWKKTRSYWGLKATDWKGTKHLFKTIGHFFFVIKASQTDKLLIVIYNDIVCWACLEEHEDDDYKTVFVSQA